MQRIKAVHALIAAGVAASSLMVSAQPASAANDCDSIAQTKVVTGYDQKRVRAICNALNANRKAKGTLIRGLGNSDANTPWFTKLKTYYYSDYKTCSPLAPCQGTRVTIESV